MNNWYVITGAPSSGKTTLVKLLEKRGHRVVHEAAREYIDQEIAKGKTIEEIRKDEREFQDKVLEMKLEIEKKFSKDEIVFFDRGIPDSLAYYKLYGWEINPALARACEECEYKKVLILDFYDLDKDYARTESREQQIKIHDLLEESYRDLGFEVINIPKVEVKEHRADYVLKIIEKGNE